MSRKRSVLLNKSSFKSTVRLPGSKSESNRALMIAAYGGFKLRAKGLSTAADTYLLMQNLEQIHFSIESSVPLVVDCENAGTVLRFLTTYLAGLPGNWMLTGSYRMKNRPLATLVEALNALGASVRHTEQQGYPPLMIKGSDLIGGKMRIDMSKSSQFASSLLLAAPHWRNGLEMKLTGSINSMPYLEMTLDMMQYYGAEFSHQGHNIVVYPKPYTDRVFQVSRDWSSASYWYELVALSDNSEILLRDLRIDSMQGDRVLVKLFSSLGVDSHQTAEGIQIAKSRPPQSEMEFDFSDCPDLMPALAASCAGLGVHATFSGLSNLKYKESDRTSVMERELMKLGCVFHAVNEDVYKLIPAESIPKSIPVFDTYGDHRIAMALAPLALKTGYVVINNPDVVVKSYPDFWDELEQIDIFTIADES